MAAFSNEPIQFSKTNGQVLGCTMQNALETIKKIRLDLPGIVREFNGK